MTMFDLAVQLSISSHFLFDSRSSCIIIIIVLFFILSPYIFVSYLKN